MAKLDRVCEIEIVMIENESRTMVEKALAEQKQVIIRQLISHGLAFLRMH